MAKIQCKDTWIETDELEIFCQSSIVLSSIILGLLINGLLVGIYFASRSINPLLIGIILDALFGGYVLLTKDYSRGEFIGIVGDTLYIRTVGGRESIVRNEEIDRIRTYNLPS